MFEEKLCHNKSPTILRSELRAAYFNIFKEAESKPLSCSQLTVV